MIQLTTPIPREDLAKLQVGDRIEISGDILCGRDAVLPKIVRECREHMWDRRNIPLAGQVIFHTAVSPAGVGPTSSNKWEIEESIGPLSEQGVAIHLGKGKLKPETVRKLAETGAIFAVIPPVTALLGKRTASVSCIAFEELGMEALWRIRVSRFPAIVAVSHGRCLDD